MYLQTDSWRHNPGYTTAPIGHGYRLSVSASPARGMTMKPKTLIQEGKVSLYLPSFSLCSASAIDSSMTELAYGEVCNRNGLTAQDIGEAVIKAAAQLDSDIGQVIVRFSADT